MPASLGTDIYHCLLSQDLCPFHNQYSDSLLLPGSFSPCGTTADLPRGLILPWYPRKHQWRKEKTAAIAHQKRAKHGDTSWTRKETLGYSLLAKGLIIHKTKLHKMQLKELWAFLTKIHGILGVSVIRSKDQQLSTAAPCVSHALRRSCTDYLEQVGVLACALC